MDLGKVANYVIYENPISRNVIHVTKTLIGDKSSATDLAQKIIMTPPTPLWKLAIEQGPFVKLAGLSGAIAVALSAYGAHKSYPKDREKELRVIFDTANKFHFLHTLALLGAPLSKHPQLSGSLFIIGTTLFAGTCYYHAISGENKFGKLAPIGGTILIVGWLTLLI